MGIYEHFPYTNFHELNLDIIIREIKRLSKKIDDLKIGEGYITEEKLQEELVDYETKQELINKLLNYITNEQLDIKLEDYITEADLSNFITQDDLSRALMDYVMQSALTQTLANYVTNSGLNAAINDLTINPGDIISDNGFTSRNPCAGYITSSKKRICYTIPLSKPIRATSVSINIVALTVRSNVGYVGGTAYLDLTNVTEITTHISDIGVSVELDFANSLGPETLLNNTPISVLSEHTLTFS